MTLHTYPLQTSLLPSHTVERVEVDHKLETVYDEDSDTFRDSPDMAASAVQCSQIESQKIFDFGDLEESNKANCFNNTS